MRRIAGPADRERGGIAVIVALLMVVLLGFAAISIDVAKLYSERAQLQNGSDSAALMVAHKCAKSETDTNCSATAPMAADLANKNAVDGLSNVKSIALDKPNRTVQVTAGAKETGSTTNSVSLFFAGVLGIPSAEVSASSSVRWGSPVEGTTPFPLAFSVCQVSGMVNGATQLLQNHTSNANADCGLGPAGKTVPGGFAWIVQSTGQCGGLVNLAINQSGSDTGNDGPSNCDAVLNKWAAELECRQTRYCLAAGLRRCQRNRFRSLLRLAGLRIIQCAGVGFQRCGQAPAGLQQRVIFRQGPAMQRRLPRNHWKVCHLRLPR